MDYDYQEATETRQATRRWPVVVGLMSGFAGGALSATMLQHNAKRGDPMLLGATTPPFKAQNVTSVDEFIDKSPGSIVALGGKFNKYEKLAYGTNGCPAGLEIKSLAECWTAIQSLTSKTANTWTASLGSIPRYCSVREAGHTPPGYPVDTVGAKHFNTGSTGSGRSDLAPICKKPLGTCAANEIMSCIPCKAGQHPDGQGKLCLDDKCHCINGVASSPPQEWMLTDPSALAKACTSNGANQCSACFQGYFPHGSHCWSNTCHCKNGVGTTAAACSSNGAQQCSSCDQGYWLHGKECKINICHCMDGRGFRGKRCPSHHSNKCEKCSEDYHIVGITCEEDEVLAMAGVNCHCLNGRGARGANCPRHNASICESCAEGHHLLGFTCVEDVEEVSLVASVTAPPTQPAAMQLDEPELNEPEGPYAENKHKEAKSTRLLDNEVARGVTYGFVGAAVGSVATVAVMSFDKEKKLSEPLLA